MNTQVEYRVRPVTRYVVTRYETELPIPGRQPCKGVSSQHGEFENFDTAYAVGYALCRAEHERLGYPPADERIVYPDPAPPLDRLSQAHLFRKMADSLQSDAAKERLMAERPEMFGKAAGIGGDHP